MSTWVSGFSRLCESNRENSRTPPPPCGHQGCRHWAVYSPTRPPPTLDGRHYCSQPFTDEGTETREGRMSPRVADRTDAAVSLTRLYGHGILLSTFIALVCACHCVTKSKNALHGLGFCCCSVICSFLLLLNNRGRHSANVAPRFPAS